MVNPIQVFDGSMIERGQDLSKFCKIFFYFWVCHLGDIVI